MSDFRLRRSLVPHIESCISLWKDGPFISTDSGLDQINVADRFSLPLEESGSLQEALELKEKVLEARQRTLGSKHPDTLAAMQGLANSYDNLGRWQEAIELFEKVLEASQRTLGSKHPNTLAAMQGLANSYSGLGRRQEAMELDEKVLEARQRTLGSEHPDTLNPMQHLAISKIPATRSQGETPRSISDDRVCSIQSTSGRQHLQQRKKSKALDKARTWFKGQHPKS
jgi:tetratricopeptide (TPR) repeat protein